MSLSGLPLPANIALKGFSEHLKCQNSTATQKACQSFSPKLPTCGTGTSHLDIMACHALRLHCSIRGCLERLKSLLLEGGLGDCGSTREETVDGCGWHIYRCESIFASLRKGTRDTDMK